ncbi:MAG TPA: type II toxin-antitoxin system VapC family toxin [Mycobacteriales bacterium]
MSVYLDTSLAVHATLPDGNPLVRRWLDQVATSDEVVSSTLLRLELTRVCRRDGLDPNRASVVLDRVREVSINDSVLRDAGALEPHVRSLDAIHLATCALLGPGVTLATHDRAMKQAARDIGLDVIDPLTKRAPE